MGLVAALYIAHALAIRLSGHGLSAVWLAALVLPGALAAHLARTSSRQYDAEREGVRAGVLTAHFAAILQVVVLVIGVLNVDWAAYSAQVGADIGNGVRESAPAATVVAAVALIGITYAGCVAASWVGAAVYRKVLG
jgi:hypothetical protein